MAHGIRPIVPEELAAGTDLATEIQRALVQADFVIGVLPARRSSSSVLFELGQAWALGKQILVIASPRSEAVPPAFQRLLVLRIELNNREAIDFALDQMMSSLRRDTPVAHPRDHFTSSGFGEKADLLLERLNSSITSKQWPELEQIAKQALESSGVDIIVESPQRDRGADFAVWSDVLEPFVGNPLLVEVKGRITDSQSAKRSFDQLLRYVAASHTKWALLLYADGPPANDRVWKLCPPNVLLMSLRSLIEALRTHAFPEVVRDLRNQRVHSVRP